MANDCIEVQWRETLLNDNITHYTIRLQPFQTYYCGAIGSIINESSLLINVESGAATSQVVCDLTPSFLYYVSVTAVLTEGLGMESQTTVLPNSGKAHCNTITTT